VLVFDAIFHPPTPQELGVPFTEAPAYLMTLPFLISFTCYQHLLGEYHQVKDDARTGFHYIVDIQPRISTR
jgi:hypothetical protein